MNHVLGFTDTGARAAPFAVLELFGVGVLVVPSGGGRSARERLALQVHCSEALESFLPIAPACPVPSDALERSLYARADEIARQLERVRGKVQVTIQCHDDAPARADRADVWLQARARWRSRHRNALDMLAACCRRLGAEAVAASPNRLDVLCARARLGEMLGGLGSADMAPEGPGRLGVTVTGPWPVFAFVTEAATS
ncbi:hypothetical protein P6F26_08160 [Roseibacterium sp. SDUM158017]|uniref:hypothetical protein n=1 Tax=Roseicyclus salinarum TaxID=3036773 RepID=UPI002415267E|nr:hypothetical protein [Roseibacterium sp. SDUM158017]MDG4648416.1 hypothetical protein [Roseibacterium sp. SDUM158017]